MGRTRRLRRREEKKEAEKKQRERAGIVERKRDEEIKEWEWEKVLLVVQPIVVVSVKVGFSLWLVALRTVLSPPIPFDLF